MCALRGQGDTPLTPAYRRENLNDMATTSVNFRPTRPGCEAHNRREKKLPHVRQDLTHLNENWQKDTIAQRQAFIKENTKAKTGRAMQDKATPIREAVIVIDEKTTMAQLQQLSEAMRTRWGIDVFQISIHRDEGHYVDGNWKPNLHAHIVADWTNHRTGKSLKLNRYDMSEMQTMAAEILKMDRGVPSDKKHLDAIAYKIQEQEQRLEQINRKISPRERILGLVGESAADKENKSLRQEKKVLEEEIKQLKETQSTLEWRLKNAQQLVNSKEASIDTIAKRRDYWKARAEKAEKRLEELDPNLKKQKEQEQIRNRGIKI